MVFPDCVSCCLGCCVVVDVVLCLARYTIGISYSTSTKLRDVLIFAHDSRGLSLVRLKTTPPPSKPIPRGPLTVGYERSVQPLNPKMCECPLVTQLGRSTLALFWPDDRFALWVTTQPNQPYDWASQVPPDGVAKTLKAPWWFLSLVDCGVSSSPVRKNKWTICVRYSFYLPDTDKVPSWILG